MSKVQAEAEIKEAGSPVEAAGEKKPVKAAAKKAAAKKTVNPLLGGREYLIPIDGAEALLKEIGILTA